MNLTLTSKDANKLLAQLTNEYNFELMAEHSNSTFVAATIEDKEAVRPEYDYSTTKSKLDEINAKIIKIRHALNRFNVTTVVPEFGMTIDEMLVYIPQLSEKKRKLQTMKSRQKFERVKDNSKSSIIDYRYVNYDLDKVTEDYKTVEDELAKAQIALDRVNISVEFEVDM